MQNPPELSQICPQQPGESAKHYAAFRDYCLMGVGRSLSKLKEFYESVELPPTRRRPTLAQWSAKFIWGDRCAAWDEAYLRFKTKQQSDQRRKQALETEEQRYRDSKAWDKRLRAGLAKLYLKFTDALNNLDDKTVTPWEVKAVCSTLLQLIQIHHLLQDGTALRSSDATLSAIYLLVEQGILDEKVAQGVTVAHEEMKTAVEDGIRQTYSDSHS